MVTEIEVSLQNLSDISLNENAPALATATVGRANKITTDITAVIAMAMVVVIAVAVITGNK